MDLAVADKVFPVRFFWVLNTLPKTDKETPSIADEVATLRTIPASSSDGSFKKGFVSKRLFFFII